jgi:hypothetical protein
VKPKALACSRRFGLHGLDGAFNQPSGHVFVKHAGDQRLIGDAFLQRLDLDVAGVPFVIMQL